MQIKDLIQLLEKYPENLNLEVSHSLGYFGLHVVDDITNESDFLVNIPQMKNKDYEAYPKLPNLNGLDY